MEGNQSLALLGLTNAADTRVTLGITDVVGQDSSLIKGELLISAMGSSSGTDSALTLVDNASTLCTIRYVDAGDTYKLQANVTGGANATTVAQASLGVVYNVWIRLIEGTADDTQCSVAFSDTETEPTSGDNYSGLSTGGTTEGSVDRMQFYGDYTSASDGWDVYWGFIQAKGNQ